LIATAIILFFALLGTDILSALGVTFPALQAAGGIILLIIAIDMIFGTQIGGSTMSVPESDEARVKDEIAVFPLATPILAGPGAMSGAMLLMANAGSDVVLQLSVIAALFAVMALSLALLIIAQELKEWIGVTAQKVIVRVSGILLAAIAMQSLFNGIAGAAIFVKTAGDQPANAESLQEARADAKIHDLDERCRASVSDQCRYGHDHSQAIPEDHQADGTWQRAVL
jgi:multiple antibiotic resistance protein